MKNDLIRDLYNNHSDLLLNPGFRAQNDPECFSYDGIVDETVFENESTKLLYLVKETTATGIRRFRNDPDKYRPEEFIGENWNFIKSTNRLAWEQQDAPNSWDALCFWTEAFKNPSKSYVEAQKCGKNLLSIAIVNIKKTPGESQSDNELLEKIARDAEYGMVINREIDLIDPHIVICCGTFGLAKIICDVQSNDVKPLDCGPNYFVYNHRFYVEFIHPSQRGAAANKCITYAYAKEVFREIKEKSGLG